MSKPSSSSSSSLSRHGLGGPKSPSLKKDLQWNRSCMLRIGERLMRAGSEGNLVQRPALNRDSDGAAQPGASQEHSGKAAKVSSAVALYANPDCLLQRRYHSSSKQFTAYRSAPNSPSTLPRSHAGAASRGQQRGLSQDCEGQRRDMFLDRLWQVSTANNSSSNMGPEELKEVKRGSRLPRCGFALGLTEQDSAEAMSDENGLPGTLGLPTGFSRGSRARASLPLSHSTPMRERALGVLYLQLGEETKQVQLCSELCSLDALRALFVKAFPQQLTMKLLQSPSTVFCVKDSSRNSYYALEDVRSISPHCCLKVYLRDPGPGFRPGQSCSTEPRISKELLYGGHRSALHSLQGSMSPPVVRSVPSSPSRTGQGSATLPRQRPQGAGRSAKFSSNSSAILERRDVMPDEDAGPSLALVLRPEAATPPHPPDSRCSSVRGTSQCSAPPSLCVDLLERGAGAGQVLPRFHASVKPLLTHGEHLETNSLQRPKMRQKYGDFPLLGPRSPPASPQRRSEGQIIGGLGLVSPLPPDSNGKTNGVPVPAESYSRGRSHGSSSSNSSVFADSPLAQAENVFSRHLTASGSQSERISVMEEQIASLAGLVHRALSVGAEIPEIHDFPSENGPHSLSYSRSVPAGRQKRPVAQCVPISENGLKHRLSLAQRSVSDLRLQLDQLRALQLSNQDSVRSQLRVMGQELLDFMREKLLQAQDAAYGPRAEVKRGRRDYVSSQDRMLKQLSELEVYVGGLQRMVRSSPGSVSLRDVELAAVNLRKVGQAMAVLKGEFPELQSRMCSVLRLEVEVVRFLKEEPLKMDSMLSRIRNLTEDLSTLHRSVSESLVPTKDDPLHKDTDHVQPNPQGSPKPLPRSSFRVPLSSSETEGVQTGPASPGTARRAKTTASTEQSLSGTTEEASREDSGKETETKRLTPDGSVRLDSDRTGTDQGQDQPESSQSLQETLASRERPAQGQGPASDQETSSGAEQNKSVQVREEDAKRKDEVDSRLFKRPERPSTQKNSSLDKISTWSPAPQSSTASSGVVSEKSENVTEAAGAQVEREKVHPAAPQPKPPRQPPEVKPKPQKCPALVGSSGSAHGAARTAATTTGALMGDKEEKNDTSQVTVHASLQTQTTVERTCTADLDHPNKPKQLTTLLPLPPPQIYTHHSSAGTEEICQNDVKSGQKMVQMDKIEVHKMTNAQVKTDPITVHSKSLPVLQRYAANIVSLEQISGKSIKTEDIQLTTSSGPTPNLSIQDTTTQNSMEKGSTKMAELGNRDCNGTNTAFDNQGFEEFCTDFSQEPFIVFWNEPIDIEAAFKRLSTIFECEEELAKSRESVLNEDYGAPVQFTFQGEVKQDKQDSDLVKKTENKKKFKLKFPKNKLAQISRAIRSGSAKANKKTEEKETDVKNMKHANGQGRKNIQISSPRPQKQVKQLCQHALDSIDSLEESIKQLEISVDSFGIPSSPPQSPGGTERHGESKDKCSTSKRPAPQILKDTQSPQTKRPKPGQGSGRDSVKQTHSDRSSSSSDASQEQPKDPSLSPKNSSRKRQSSNKQSGQAITVPQ